MSLLNRLGTSRQEEVLRLTVHTVNVTLPESCLVKLVIRPDGAGKASTQYAKYDPTYPVTSLESAHSFHIEIFHRKLKTLKKSIKFTLMMLQDIKEVENGRAELEVQNLSVGGPGLVRTLLPLKKCTDAQGSICLSVSRKLPSAHTSPSHIKPSDKTDDQQQQGEAEIEGRKRQNTFIPLPSAVPQPKIQRDLSDDEDEDDRIVVKRYATISNARTVPTQVCSKQARKSYEYRKKEVEESSGTSSDSSSDSSLEPTSPKEWRKSGGESPVKLSLNLTNQKLPSTIVPRDSVHSPPPPISTPVTESLKSSSSPAKPPDSLLLSRPGSIPVTSLKSAPANVRSNPANDTGRTRTTVCAACTLQ